MTVCDVEAASIAPVSGYCGSPQARLIYAASHTRYFLPCVLFKDRSAINRHVSPSHALFITERSWNSKP